MGGRLIGSELAREIVTTWLATPFEAGRHERRVAQLDEA
jgi:ribose 5-phosphate isomerase B